MKVKDRVKIVCCKESPYYAQKGVIVRLQENTDKKGEKTIIYIVRLDKPHAFWAQEVGFPKEALEKI